MPLPTPQSDEDKNEFIDRCMADDVMNREFNDTDVRLAVCVRQWDNSTKESNIMKEKHRIVEYTQHSNLSPLSESQIKEEEGSQDDHIVGGFRVPVWRLDVPNANGRTYTSELASRIASEGKTTLSLDGHPQDETSVSYEDVKAIGKNPHIEDGKLWADALFVDEAYFNKIQKIVQNGGKVGLSSSGFGLIDDNGVVEPDSYELDRYFDFVLHPAAHLYVEQHSSPSDTTASPSSAEEDDESDSAESQVSEEEVEMIKYINNIKEKRRQNI